MSYDRLFITNFLLIPNSEKYVEYSQLLLYHGCAWSYIDSMPVMSLGWFKHEHTSSPHSQTYPLQT